MEEQERGSASTSLPLDAGSLVFGLPVGDLLSGIEQSSSGILIVRSSDLQICLVNAAAREIYGSIEVGQHLTAEGRWEFFGADGMPIPSDRRPLLRAIAHGERIRDAEVSVRTPSGDFRHTLVDATPIKDRNGIVTSVMLVVTDITERREVIDQAVRELSFQTLLTRIASTLLAAPVSDQEAAMVRALRDVALHFGLDQFGCWWLSTDRTGAERGPYWQQRGHEPAATSVGLEDLPWLFPRLASGEICAVADVNDLPEEAAIDRAWARRHGVSAVLHFPITAGGRTVGSAEAAMFEGVRNWTDGEIAELQLAADLLATSQIRSDQQLRIMRQNRELEHVQALSRIGSLTYDLDREVGVLSEEAAAILGVDEMEIDVPRFAQLVHPEDRDRAIARIRAGLASETQLHQEYRILRGDQVRHIVERSSAVKGTRMWVATFMDVTEEHERLRALEASYRQIRVLQSRLEAENRHLREEIDQARGHGTILGASAQIRQCIHDMERVAPTDATVLISGETGTGKELIAKGVHDLSPRADGPLITVNCAALPPALIENELFGHDRGAYTGADKAQMGCFELANGGTLFLDEIGELPMEVQGKLLRAIQEKEIQRLGSSRTRPVDVRLVAATNRELSELVDAGLYRSDLYYRLNVFQIRLPALRDRREDIPTLVQHSVDKIAPRIGKHVEGVSSEALRALRNHDWPGNVRELENVIERAIITARGAVLEVSDLVLRTGSEPAASGSKDASWRSLDEIDHDHILSVLEATGWQIEGSGGAASVLRINPSTLRSRMRKLGIKRPAGTMPDAGGTVSSR